MKCEHCCTLLDAHVEDLLMPLDRASVEAHLGECEDCAREVRRIGVLVHALRELPDAEVPDDLIERVMSDLPEMLPAQEGTSHLVRWGLVAAAATLAFVAALAMLPQSGGLGVASDTFAPVSASFQLGGSVLAHAFSALASVLDASASQLIATGFGAKMLFALLLIGSNAALAVAVHGYRHSWLLPSAALGSNRLG